MNIEAKATNAVKNKAVPCGDPAIVLEKEKLATRTNLLNESANDIANGLTEIHRLKEELERRLAVIPMDLSAAEIEEEWKKIDQEKLRIKKSSEELQMALDRLADAQAAMDLMQ